MLPDSSLDARIHPHNSKEHGVLLKRGEKELMFSLEDVVVSVTGG